jgi:hypothetical protein
MDFLRSAAIENIRSEFGYPVIDGDGGLLEFVPPVRDLAREDAGDQLVALLDEAQFRSSRFRSAASRMTAANPDLFAGTAVEDAAAATA